MDTIQAAILRVKLRNLDLYNEARRSVAQKYDLAFKDLPGVSVPFRSPWSSHIFHQYTLRVNPGDRNSLREFLSAREIPTMIYYPVPLHKQKAYSYLDYDDSMFRISCQLSDSVISLPMHTELDDEQISHIISTFA